DVVLQSVLGLRKGGGVERVRLDDVGAGLKILAVNILDDLGVGNIQEVVVQPQTPRVAGEFLAPVVGLGEIVSLDDGADGAVENHDAAVQDFLELGQMI